MNEKTAKQIQKQIQDNEKANAVLRNELNKMAQSGIDDQIKTVEASLKTLIADDNFDVTELKQTFKSLLSKCYGSTYDIKVVKKPTSATFKWVDLLAKMKEAGLTNENKSATRKELEKLYFENEKTIFKQEWNKKPKGLKIYGKKAGAKYYV